MLPSFDLRIDRLGGGLEGRKMEGEEGKGRGDGEGGGATKG